MKKLLYIAVFGTALALTSCGPTPCDCVKMGKEMQEKMSVENADVKEIEKEYKEKLDACKKMQDSKSKEDLEKAMENCK